MLCTNLFPGQAVLKVYLESHESSVFLLKTDDEYRQFIEKYSAVRTEFETKMTDACKVIAVNVFICLLLILKIFI